MWCLIEDAERIASARGSNQTRFSRSKGSTNPSRNREPFLLAAWWDNQRRESLRRIQHDLRRLESQQKGKSTAELRLSTKLGETSTLSNTLITVTAHYLATGATLKAALSDDPIEVEQGKVRV